MVIAANIEATAVNTIRWLSAAETSIVVPVYQRQYRWDIGACEQLLADIRAVADADDGQTHFIGSILSTRNGGDAGNDLESESDGELILIDGQQRITTLMLLVAAMHHTVLHSNDLDIAQGGDVKTMPTALALQLQRILVRASGPRQTKLRPHTAWAEVFENVILDRADPSALVSGGLSADAGEELRDSRFHDNYAFFRSQVGPREVAQIWRGLQRIEHVAITLGANANAQQTFESLNSTGEPLRDHELIHNYVLMGLSHAEQSEIEEQYWIPIEQNTGESIASFWRHYLVMTTGREVSVSGERGVYDAFRQQFPRLDLQTLRENATIWREFSAVYRVLLQPQSAPEAAIAGQLEYANTFGRGMYPLMMWMYHDYSTGAIDRDRVIRFLEQLQAVLLRRAVVGVGNARLVARLCRARRTGGEDLVAALARITPSDERVRIALKYSDLPHAAYVLARLSGASSVAEYDIEHVFPLAPSDSWSGDGERLWSDYSDDEQNSHRALAQTLGNLALLEPVLAERAAELSFVQKRGAVYSSSAVESTRQLAGSPTWGTAAIAERTARLTASFLTLWARPAAVAIDDDGLTPILDAERRRGWPRGWEREFEYVEFRGEHWEVHDVKYLFNRIFKRLWADARAEVIAFGTGRGGPIFATMAWNGHWDALDEANYLYMGWDSKYMLAAIQGVLLQSGLASEVFVKYSYSAAAM